MTDISGQSVLTVNDLLALEVLRSAQVSVAAGGHHLANRVEWVHVFETPAVTGMLRGGEFLLTTGIALAGMTTAELDALVASVARAGAAGMGLEPTHAPARAAGPGLPRPRAAAAGLRPAGEVRGHHPRRARTPRCRRAGHAPASGLAAGAAAGGRTRRAGAGRTGGGAGRRAGGAGAARAERPHPDRHVARGRARRGISRGARPPSPAAADCPALAAGAAWRPAPRAAPPGRRTRPAGRGRGGIPARGRAGRAAAGGRGALGRPRAATPEAGRRASRQRARCRPTRPVGGRRPLARDAVGVSRPGVAGAARSGGLRRARSTARVHSWRSAETPTRGRSPAI